MKELASITRSTFSAVDFHSTDHILAAVGFCCYYWKAVWICLSVTASTRSFGRRVKRIEISKSVPRLAHLFLFTKSAFKYSGECFESQLSGISGLKKLHFLLVYIHSMPIRPRFPTVVATPTVLNCCTRVTAKANRPARNKAKVKRLYTLAKQTKTHIKRRFKGVFNIPEENWKERARLKANKW